MLRTNAQNSLLCLAIFAALVLGCVAPRGNRRESNHAGPVLRLLSHHGDRSYNYLTINGEVRNLTNEKLESVWVVVSCYDSSGSLVTSEDGVIDYQPLMPGQTSPFKVMIRDNPAIQTYRVSFKEIFGAQIPYDEAPAPSSPTPKGRR